MTGTEASPRVLWDWRVSARRSAGETGRSARRSPTDTLAAGRSVRDAIGRVVRPTADLSRTSPARC